MRSIPMTLWEWAIGSKQPSTALRLALCALILLLPGCAGMGDRSRSFTTVIIDAGHGGHDYGTRASRPLPEKSAALDVALRLEPKLRAAGYKTVMTRKGDYFVGLDDRVAISNRQSNAVFVSIHFNEARRKRYISGAEVYYHSASSERLARHMLQHIARVPGSKARFVKQARFRVLRNNKNPAILIEGGYFSNSAEAARFSKADQREKLADEIARALRTHHR